MPVEVANFGCSQQETEQIKKSHKKKTTLTMKKLLIATAAALALCACSSEKKYLTYQGISMGIPAKVMEDSLVSRGLALDTAVNGQIMLYKPGTAMRVVINHQNNVITSIQESYEATYNDSTRNLFKATYDRFLEEINAHPEMPFNSEDHKEARFQTKYGMVTVLLENTYTPQYGVVYEVKSEE